MGGYEQLPIQDVADQIAGAIQKHRVVIIQGETGCGKSTQVPQQLLPYTGQVIVTQPRRLAAINVAKRVAEEMGVKIGSMVGYHTATGRKATDETRILFCTDGIEVMWQVFQGSPNKDAIVVIDEAHEWNLNMELLMAWFRLRVLRSMNTRLVIMSATIDAEHLASYFEDACVISAKGRTFPVVEESPVGGFLGSIKTLIERKRNVLAFVAGKEEIKRTICALERMNLKGVFLPLHAGMSPEEQEESLRLRDVPVCIVATNIAQTSLTVPFVDAVVDSGLERKPKMVDGVGGLYLQAVSRADRQQRKGRAGRVKPGIYIDCCNVSLEERSEFPTPALYSDDLGKMMLLLATVGLDPEDLVFYHEPPEGRFAATRRGLESIGCLKPDHSLTPLGTLISKLPLGVRYARMLLETRRVLERCIKVDERVLALAILLEEGGIRNYKSHAWKKYSRVFPEEVISDAYIELIAYTTAKVIPVERLDELGIDSVAFERVEERKKQLVKRLRSAEYKIEMDEHSETSIQDAIFSGLSDQIYKKSLVGGTYTRLDSTSTPRQLPPDSCVRGVEYIVGIPWNLEVETDFGPQTRRFLRAATKVPPSFIQSK